MPEISTNAQGYLTFVDTHSIIWVMWGDGWTCYGEGNVSHATKLFTTNKVTMPTSEDIDHAFELSKFMFA